MNQMLLHNWNGNPITQVAVDTKIAKFHIPANYVNATQMCKACGKQFNDYGRLETTKAYWDGLSAETVIPVSGLVISIKGGNLKQVQGTWVHPEIAIDLAQWVSVEFRIWANRTLRQTIEEKVKPEEPQNTQTPTPEEISQLLDLTLGKTDIDPKLVAGVKLNAITHYYPTLKSAAEIGKTALAIPVTDELMSPKRLGEILGESTGEVWSSQRINKLLLASGLQIRNQESNNPAYLPTEKGKQFSKLILNTASGRDKTVQSLRWLRHVLSELEMNSV